MLRKVHEVLEAAGKSVKFRRSGSCIREKKMQVIQRHKGKTRRYMRRM